MKTYEFDALIMKFDEMNAAFVEFPYDVETEFGTKRQVKVQVTFDGYSYRGSLAKMGHHCHFIGLSKEIRNAIEKNPGDIVHVILKKDEEPRTITIPEDFKALLDENPNAKEYFDSLSHSNRNYYIQWITGAKKAGTREKRLRESIEMLSSKLKHP
jgi:hypothetical protein